MSKVAFLLLTLFSITISEPKPPEKIPQLQRIQIHSVQQETVKAKTLYTMTNAELNALSVKKKAKLVHMSVKIFKEMSRVVAGESGPKLEDKVMVAVVIFNRKQCKQFPNTIRKVIKQPGQFCFGRSNDKKAQLAILLAYKRIKTGKVPHNVLYFNGISYRTRSPKRFVKYKHVNNYFLIDKKCKCKWCNGGH